MARLILNCAEVGLIMRELGRDIIMIGRGPLNEIVIAPGSLWENDRLTLLNVATIPRMES